MKLLPFALTSLVDADGELIPFEVKLHVTLSDSRNLRCQLHHVVGFVRVEQKSCPPWSIQLAREFQKGVLFVDRLGHRLRNHALSPGN
jgi:hypothetical protein